MNPSDISPDIADDLSPRTFLTICRDDGMEMPTAQDNDSSSTLSRATVSVSGRITTVQPTETRATYPWYSCRRCNTSTPSEAPGILESPELPFKCQGCERDGPYDLMPDKTEFSEIQVVTIADHAGATESEPAEIRVVLVNDLIGSVCVGDAVTTEAILTIEQRNTSEEFEKILFAIDISTDDEAQPVRTPSEEFDPSEFVARSRNILYEHEVLDEISTREKIITPFIRELGWDLYSSEVRIEYSGDADLSDRADYVLSDSPETPRVVVEAKGARRNLDPHTDQLRRYMRLFGCRYGLLTNGERYVFMGASEDSATPKEDAFLDCELEKLPLKADVVAKLHRLNFGDGSGLDVQPVEVDKIDVEKKQRQERIRAVLKKNNEDQPEEARGTLRDTLELILDSKGLDTSHLDEDLAELRDRGQIYSLEQGVLRVA